MPNDPVCGMSVDEKAAPVRTTYASQTYYFCSNECFQKFNAKPRNYTESTRDQTGSSTKETREPVKADA